MQGRVDLDLRDTTRKRMVGSALGRAHGVLVIAEQAVRYDSAGVDELAAVAEGWWAWAAEPGAVFSVLHGEILARA